MNDHVRLDILHKLAITPVNNNSFENPSDYLNWFLTQVSNMFGGNIKLRFTNIQYFTTDNITNEDFLHGRLLNIPTLIDLSVIGENNLLKTLTDVTAFLAATSVIQHFHSEPNRATINTFRDRLKIETIREPLLDITCKKIFFNKTENLITILLPDLYNQENSELLLGKEFFKPEDLTIEKINKNQILLEGASFNNKLDLFSKSHNFDLFIKKVLEHINSNRIQNLVQNYINESLTLDFFNSENNSVDLTKSFILTSFTHSWLKPNNYDYQLIVSKYNGKQPTAYGVFLINTDTKISIELLKYLQLSLNIAFNNISQILEWSNTNHKADVKKPKSEEKNSVIGDSAFIYSSEKMKTIDYEITKFARTDESVLLLGETGVGKDLIAYEIHKRSKRKDKPYVSVPLGSLSEQIIDAELFGSVKGSYTGSTETRKGKFEEAEGGTIYLPEIAEIPLNIQIKLLEFLQYKTISKVGGTKTKLNVRTIFASNNNLELLLAEGKLRTDFYHRIFVLKILVPPLRNRKEDIIALAKHFTTLHSNRITGEEYTISSDVDGVLTNQEWKGNVRQLEHFIIRAIVNSDKPEIHNSTIEKLLSEQSSEINKLNSDHIKDLKSTEREFKKQYFISLIEQNDGCIAEVARIAGLTRQAVYKILNELDIKY